MLDSLYQLYHHMSKIFVYYKYKYTWNTRKRKTQQENKLKQIPSSFKQDILFQAILHLFHSQPIDTLIYYGKLGNSKKIDIKFQ